MKELSHVTSKKICSVALPRVFELLGGDLAAVEGVSSALAQAIYDHFHEEAR